MMTKEEREAARARCEAATDGPWERGKPNDMCEGSNPLYIFKIWRNVTKEQAGAIKVRFGQPDYYSVTHSIVSSPILDPTPDRLKAGRVNENLDFITHARTDLPRALDTIDELEAENETIRQALESILLRHELDELTHGEAVDEIAVIVEQWSEEEEGQ